MNNNANCDREIFARYCADLKIPLIQWWHSIEEAAINKNRQTDRWVSWTRSRLASTCYRSLKGTETWAPADRPLSRADALKHTNIRYANKSNNSTHLDFVEDRFTLCGRPNEPHCRSCPSDRPRAYLSPSVPHGRLIDDKKDNIAKPCSRLSTVRG